MWFCIKRRTVFTVLWSTSHCNVPLASEMPLVEIKKIFAVQEIQTSWTLMNSFMLTVWDSYSNLYEPEILGVMLLSLLCCVAERPSLRLLTSLLPLWAVFWDSGTKERREWEAEIVQENKSPSNNSSGHISHFNWINCTENPLSVVYYSPGALSYYIRSCLYSN